MSNYYNNQNNGSNPSASAPGDRSINVSEFQRSPTLFLASQGIDFLKRHYVFSMLWITGLLIVSFAKGIVVDNDTQREYRKALYWSDELRDTKVISSQQSVDVTYQRYYHSKGWFGRCDNYCNENYENYLRNLDEFNVIKKEYNDALSEANQIVGVFSEYGVSHARQLFWDCWQWGKDFAKRISWYDTIFLMFGRGRDESFMVYIGRFIVRILINFTIGFISALVSFIWQLWFFVKSYGGGIAGILFFFIAGLGAWSLIVTTIVAMYAATAATVGGVMMVAQNQAIRSGRGGGQRRQQHLHFN